MIGKPPLQSYDFLVLAGLLGIFMVFIYPSYGTLHLTYDSYDYIAASKSIDSYLVSAIKLNNLPTRIAKKVFG